MASLAEAIVRIYLMMLCDFFLNYEIKKKRGITYYLPYFGLEHSCESGCDDAEWCEGGYN